jgi:hypothetical protein
MIVFILDFNLRGNLPYLGPIPFSSSVDDLDLEELASYNPLLIDFKSPRYIQSFREDMRNVGIVQFNIRI